MSPQFDRTTIYAMELPSPKKAVEMGMFIQLANDRGLEDSLQIRRVYSSVDPLSATVGDYEHAIRLEKIRMHDAARASSIRARRMSRSYMSVPLPEMESQHEGEDF